MIPDLIAPVLAFTGLSILELAVLIFLIIYILRG